MMIDPLACLETAAYDEEQSKSIYLTRSNTSLTSEKNEILCNETSHSTSNTEKCEMIDISGGIGRIGVKLGKSSVLQMGNNNHMYVQGCGSKHPYISPRKNERRTEDLKVPRRLINSDDIDMIAVHLGNDWRRFGTKLGFRKGELDAFEFDHGRDGLHEIIYQMLLAWQEKKGTNAFVKDIVTQLIAVKRKDIAKMFRVD